VVLDLDQAESFLEQAPAELERLGVELIGPEQLVKGGVAVRGTATPAPADDRQSRFGRDTLVSWTLAVTGADGPAAITAAELARAETAGATLLRSGRRWVRLDPAALRKARARLVEHRRDHERVDAVTLLRLAADDTAGAGDDADRAQVTGEAWAADLLAGLPDERLREEHEPPGFTGALRHYQRRGLAWLRFLDRLGLGGCLADDMGLGKTATALAHLLERPGPHLVVCPLSVVRNWESEAARFTPGMRVVVHHGADRSRPGDGAGELAGADLVVTTYGLLARDAAHLAAIQWSTVVLDEAQMIKNPATHAARAVRQLRSGQKIALTGTPVENRLAELWAILDAVNPGMLGSRERFRRRFAGPIERSGDAGAAARLRRLTQPFVLRRSKADRQLVPDLPDKIEQIAWAGLTREQGVLYQQVVEQLLADAAATTGMRRRGLVLAALTRLKQICNHPAHALGDGSRLSGRSGKLARFDELVDELLDVDERALVFTQFREMGELLRRHLLERLGIEVPFLHGGVARARRDGMVSAFQHGAGPPVLLVSLKAGGTGLNLTAASQVIHYDRWWNPAVEDQATDRAWRIGQGRTVLVHKLVCEGTVEERIGTVIDDKRRLADAVVGSGEAWLSELSTDELRELVRLDASEPAR
jgi:non-specific serine/threonine protein kinase